MTIHTIVFIFAAFPAIRGGTGTDRRNDPCSCGSGTQFRKCCLH
ncbi:MAG: hypothetical protein B7X93_11270 [Hydrogenophilales bacterium 17-61-9]|nr:MAG: hypothetical protein B7X93_11270 [Hydrogenophilales bacterium 17-61-9]